MFNVKSKRKVNVCVRARVIYGFVLSLL